MMVNQCESVCEDPENIVQRIREDRVRETEFTTNHPVVVDKTKSFKERAEIARIFSHTWRCIAQHPTLAPFHVGPAWLEFSQTMPWVLCRLASAVDNNQVRHYIVQGAFEELGGRDNREIHPELFKQSIGLVGVGEFRQAEFQSGPGVQRSINYLKYIVDNADSTAEVLGMCLGLEIPAIENIQTVFEGLTTDKSKREAVRNSPFFLIHYTVEEEHIRLNVSNFLRFCKSTSEVAAFSSGFNASIRFWRHFWQDVAWRIEEGAKH